MSATESQFVQDRIESSSRPAAVRESIAYDHPKFWSRPELQSAARKLAVLGSVVFRKQITIARSHRNQNSWKRLHRRAEQEGGELVLTSDSSLRKAVVPQHRITATFASGVP